MSSDEHDDEIANRTSGAFGAAFGVLAVVALAAIVVAFAPRGAWRRCSRRRSARRRAAGRLRAERAGDGRDAALRRPSTRRSRTRPASARTPSRSSIDRIERGEATLAYDGERGYLESLLAALDIDPASQTLVFSQTSLQSRLIGPRTPRAIYFNDDTYVAFVQQGPIEIALRRSRISGPVFYLLDQAPAAAADVRGRARQMPELPRLVLVVGRRRAALHRRVRLHGHDGHAGLARGLDPHLRPHAAEEPLGRLVRDGTARRRGRTSATW